MLENIKMLLEIDANDTTQDKKINYHIQNIINKIFAYCGIKQLPTELESVVESIVYDKLSLNDGYKDRVKKEKFDDFEVEYAVNTQNNELDSYASILDEYKNKSKNKEVKFV